MTVGVVGGVLVLAGAAGVVGGVGVAGTGSPGAKRAKARKSAKAVNERERRAGLRRAFFIKKGKDYEAIVISVLLRNNARLIKLHLHILKLTFGRYF